MRFSGIILTILNLCVLCVHSETSDKNCNNSSENTPPIVEYSLDHEVSSKDAKAAAMEITDDALNSVPKWCLPCSKKSIQYCLGHHLLHDHCCCEHGHTREKLPYIPHSCYIGENHCYPHMGSCNLYTEMWECCCQKILAQKWKSTYSSSSRCWNHLMTSYLLLFIPSLIFLFSLPFRL